MTEKQARESIKKDIGVTDEYINAFCKHNNFTVFEYRAWLDRAMKARKEATPKDYPKAIIITTKKDI